MTKEEMKTFASPLETLEWQVHPFFESRRRALLSILGPLVVSALVYLWSASRLWTILGFLLLISAEFPFFLRSFYRFDSAGVTLRRAGAVFSRGWDQIKSYYPDRNGVLLSPFARPHWLENFRGLYIQFGRHRQEVLAYLNSRLGPPTPSRPGGEKNTDRS